MNGELRVPSFEWRTLRSHCDDAPSKILIFAYCEWRTPYSHCDDAPSKVATREALSRRGVLHSQWERSCVICFKENESADHLFRRCEVSNVIWQSVFGWMGVDGVEADGVKEHFMEFGRRQKEQKRDEYYMDGGDLEHLASKK